MAKKQEKYAHIAVAQEVLADTKKWVQELNLSSNKYGISAESEEKHKKKRGQNKVGFNKKGAKLNLKTFTEAALLHFVKYKIDPRFYEAESIPTAINRLRNQLFAFLQVQERQIMLPFQQDISQLKLHIPETVEATAMETQGTLMGLLSVLFEMLQVDKKEQIRLEQLLQQKGIEFIESIQK